MRSPRDRGSALAITPGKVLHGTAWVVGVFALYFCFAGSVDLDEAIGACVAASATLFLALSKRRAARQRIVVVWPWQLMTQSLSKVPREIALVGYRMIVASLKPRSSAVVIQRVPYLRHGMHPPGERKAAQIFWRGITILALSFGPDRFVVDSGQRSRRLRLHQLSPEQPR